MESAAPLNRSVTPSTIVLTIFPAARRPAATAVPAADRDAPRHRHLTGPAGSGRGRRAAAEEPTEKSANPAPAAAARRRRPSK